MWVKNITGRGGPGQRGGAGLVSVGREGQCSWSVASKEEGGNMSSPEHRMWNEWRGKYLDISSWRGTMETITALHCLMFLFYFKNIS